MTDRDRLKENIQLLNKHNQSNRPIYKISNGRKYEFDVINEIVKDVSLIIEKMEKGLLIELPCKVGGVVYFHHIIGTNEDNSPIEEVRAGTIHKIQLEKDNQIWLGVSFGIWYCCRPYTDFYFSREEAEAKLKELG